MTHRFLFLILSIAVFSTFSATADLLGGYLDFNAGYRCDTFSAKMISYKVPKEIFSKDRFTAKDLQLFQVGGKGQIVICDWFVRGEAYWGWSDSGIYRKVTRMTHYDPLKNKGNLHKGRTRDFIAGIGYYFSLFDLFAIGPSAGWSYQEQQFDVTKIRFTGTRDKTHVNLEYSNCWQGPWIGFDGQFQFLGIDCRSGYSYHWAKWNGDSHQKHVAYKLGDFLNKQRSNDAYGQVAYLDILWGFCPFIEMGVGFKWQYWHAKNGKGKFKGFGDVKQMSWNSYAVLLNLGMAF